MFTKFTNVLVPGAFYSTCVGRDGSLWLRFREVVNSNCRCNQATAVARVERTFQQIGMSRPRGDTKTLLITLANSRLTTAHGLLSIANGCGSALGST